MPEKAETRRKDGGIIAKLCKNSWLGIWGWQKAVFQRGTGFRTPFGFANGLSETLPSGIPINRDTPGSHPLPGRASPTGKGAKLISK
jgi:hypothetical protein